MVTVRQEQCVHKLQFIVTLVQVTKFVPQNGIATIIQVQEIWVKLCCSGM